MPLALRVLAWRLRPLLLALALVLACALGARAGAPPPAPTVAVVVAADDLRAGDVLAAGDLRTVRVPRAAAPSGARDADDLVGEELAVDVPCGLAVVPAHLARSRFAAAAPAGTVAVPVHLADAAVAALLRPGDRVDLVAGALDGWPGEDGPAVLAEAALVLEVLTDPGTDDGDLGLLGAGAATDADPLVVVAVPADEGHRIAAAEGGSLGAVLVEGS